MGPAGHGAVRPDAIAALNTGPDSSGSGPAHGDRHLLTMYEIAKILATENDVDIMAARLLACLLNVQAIADAGALLVQEPGAEWLRVEAAQGYDLETLRRLHVSPDELMSAQALQSGQAEIHVGPEALALVTARLRPGNRVLFGAAGDGADAPYSAICVPLVADDTRVGLLLLLNREHRRGFAPEDLTLLQPVANLLALAISNARLRSELEAVQSVNEANRLKAEVISTLAHEMRTPLTSIKGYATALLMEETSFSPETQREFLQIIDEECDVLQDLIHDLLESSIIDAGFLKLDIQPVLLPRLALAIVEEFAHLSPHHRLMVDFPAPFPIVEADPQRITQVLRNLLDNAVKYSPNGGLIVVRGEVRASEVVVSVADQGEGIAPEHLNRLFEKFFRIKSGLGRHVVGTGLGLPIARTIVEGHGGRIWAESQLGQGTTFFFTIPLTASDAQPSDAQGGSDDA